MARTPEQEAFADFEYAVAFPGTSRADVTFALVKAGGEALTIAEVCEHTDVTPTTVRKTLSRLEEMGLVEETRRQRRLAFRLSPKGLLGYRTWQAEQRSAAAIAQRLPQSTAPVYRWRVSGIAVRPGTVDCGEVRSALADVGVDAAVEGGDSLISLVYEVDAADEEAALAAVRPSGWTMQQFMGARAERLGLAAGVPMRAGHEFLFADRDAATVVAALRRAVSQEISELKATGLLPSDWEKLTQEAETVSDFLALAEVPDDGRVSIPDDARLIAAVSSLWRLLEEAGVRALGASFEMSEREIRERYAALEETAGEPPRGMTWQQLCEEIVETYRKQGRLTA